MLQLGMARQDAEEGGGEVISMVDKRRQLLTRQSSVWTRRQQAVCVRRAYKKYGTNKNPNVILDGLNMTVPKGTIYGLLGASGCGKTTLLSCIVGRRRLESGELWVLGGRPGSRGSGVPGPRIGYMPQEIALYGEFTIRETMIYNGWVNGMSSQRIRERLDFLINLLMLPPAGRVVRNLSGGQQRRVSFAVALLHEPELLILDEPTVGVDPVLRQSIWDHLVSISKDGNKTVIITTHYIEETRQAHMIGLMRGGHFLAEESPADLMATHMCDSLEDVFLKLSKKQNQGKRRRSSFMQEVMATMPVPEEPVSFDMNSEISGEFGDNVSLSNRDVEIPQAGQSIGLPPDEEPSSECWDYLNVFSPGHMKAIIWKNFLWMWRNLSIMLFIIGLPVLQIVLYCLTVGTDPVGLHLAVVNRELNTTMDECVETTGCDLHTLSCRYMKHLRSHTLELDRYADEDSAFAAVKTGYAWGALTFGANYSDSLVERMEAGRDANPFVVEHGDVNVWMDMSNQHIGQMLRRDLIYSFVEFAEDILKSCNYSTKSAGIPIKFNKPVYGQKIPNFRDFAAPGVILTISFFLSVAQTSISMMIERNEGMLERSLVNGITVIEILFSHLLTQFILMAVQTALILIFAFAVFGIPCLGSFFWVTLLTLLSGLCGMCFGFFVSCVCDTERSATYMALGSFLPIIMLCGIIWPIEGMHYLLRYISFILPLTQSTDSLRTMMARAWTINEPTVYFGFVSSLIWIVIYMCTSVLVLKFKKG